MSNGRQKPQSRDFGIPARNCHFFNPGIFGTGSKKVKKINPNFLSPSASLPRIALTSNLIETRDVLVKNNQCRFPLFFSSRRDCSALAVILLVLYFQICFSTSDGKPLETVGVTGPVPKILREKNKSKRVEMGRSFFSLNFFH